MEIANVRTQCRRYVIDKGFKGELRQGKTKVTNWQETVELYFLNTEPAMVFGTIINMF